MYDHENPPDIWVTNGAGDSLNTVLLFIVCLLSLSEELQVAVIGGLRFMSC